MCMCLHRGQAIKGIVLLSLITLILSLAVIVITIARVLRTDVNLRSPIESDELELNETMEMISSYDMYIPVLLFVVGGVTGIFAFFYCIMLRFKRKIASCQVGMCSFLHTVALVLIASYIIMTTGQTSNEIVEFCSNLDQLQTNEEVSFTQVQQEQLLENIKFIDETNDLWVNEYMCTDTCPCVEVDTSLWDEPTRTQMQDKSEFNFRGSYSSFEICYQDRVSAGKWKQNEDLEKLFQIQSVLEEELQCSGICSTPIFYSSRNIADGPPLASCSVALVNQWNYYSETSMWLVIAAAVFSFLIFLTHFGLYKEPTYFDFIRRATRQRKFLDENKPSHNIDLD